MKRINVQDFEKVYTDPVPVNGNVLVEIVQRNTERTSAGGIIIQEENVNPSTMVSPYLVVVDKAEDVKKAFNLEPGDIIQQKSRNVNMFYGKEMKQYALIHQDDISAVHKNKDKNKKVPYEDSEPAKPKSKIITMDKKVIVDN